MTSVLLAEDDVSISDPLARALRREGYDVDVSADGPSTLDAAMAGGLAVYARKGSSYRC
jgi:DNA-binding response OmpR family regulator